MASGLPLPTLAALALGLGGPALALGSEPGDDKRERVEAVAALETTEADRAPPPSSPPETPSLDFDLLGAPAKTPVPSVDAGALRLRRTMLSVHQAIGFGLVGLQLATTVVGQLNYSDRFAGGPSTAQYQLTHKALAYTTLAVFAVDGLLALLAPSPIKSPRKLDRVMVHRIAMLVAALGMVAQGVTGIRARELEGYQDQERLATVHLAIGYTTLAAVLVGVGVLVF
jgi:hypothetical protein